MLNEFKAFIARGNVMDMAVGIIMGAAFTAIVNSMVGDLVMPVIGVLTSGVDFADKFVALDGNAYANLKAAKDAGQAAMEKAGDAANEAMDAAKDASGAAMGRTRWPT